MSSGHHLVKQNYRLASIAAQYHEIIADASRRKIMIKYRRVSVSRLARRHHAMSSILPILKSNPGDDERRQPSRTPRP
jgi:hypothetical protein